MGDAGHRRRLLADRPGRGRLRPTATERHAGQQLAVQRRDRRRAGDQPARRPPIAVNRADGVTRAIVAPAAGAQHLRRAGRGDRSRRRHGPDHPRPRRSSSSSSARPAQATRAAAALLGPRPVPQRAARGARAAVRIARPAAVGGAPTTARPLEDIPTTMLDWRGRAAATTCCSPASTPRRSCRCCRAAISARPCRAGERHPPGAGAEARIPGAAASVLVGASEGWLVADQIAAARRAGHRLGAERPARRVRAARRDPVERRPDARRRRQRLDRHDRRRRNAQLRSTSGNMPAISSRCRAFPARPASAGARRSAMITSRAGRGGRAWRRDRLPRLRAAAPTWWSGTAIRSRSSARRASVYRRRPPAARHPPDRLRDRYRYLPRARLARGVPALTLQIGPDPVRLRIHRDALPAVASAARPAGASDGGGTVPRNLLAGRARDLCGDDLFLPG